MNAAILNTARSIVNQARSLPRDPRSTEYWQGAEVAAARTLVKASGEDRPAFVIPYKMGTAQADAFLSGMGEGRRLVIKALE
jgi:hypothetical protein